MTDVNLIAEISLFWTRPAMRGYRNFCRRGILRPRPAIIIGSARPTVMTTLADNDSPATVPRIFAARSRRRR